MAPLVACDHCGRSGGITFGVYYPNRDMTKPPVRLCQTYQGKPVQPDCYYLVTVRNEKLGFRKTNFIVESDRHAPRTEAATLDLTENRQTGLILAEATSPHTERAQKDLANGEHYLTGQRVKNEPVAPTKAEENKGLVDVDRTPLNPASSDGMAYADELARDQAAARASTVEDPQTYAFQTSGTPRRVPLTQGGYPLSASDIKKLEETERLAALAAQPTPGELQARPVDIHGNTADGETVAGRQVGDDQLTPLTTEDDLVQGDTLAERAELATDKDALTRGTVPKDQLPDTADEGVLRHRDGTPVDQSKMGSTGDERSDVVEAFLDGLDKAGAPRTDTVPPLTKDGTDGTPLGDNEVPPVDQQVQSGIVGAKGGVEQPTQDQRTDTEREADEAAEKAREDIAASRKELFDTEDKPEEELTPAEKRQRTIAKKKAEAEAAKDDDKS